MGKEGRRWAFSRRRSRRKWIHGKEGGSRVKIGEKVETSRVTRLVVAGTPMIGNKKRNGSVKESNIHEQWPESMITYRETFCIPLLPSPKEKVVIHQTGSGLGRGNVENWIRAKECGKRECAFWHERIEIRNWHLSLSNESLLFFFPWKRDWGCVHTV